MSLAKNLIVLRMFRDRKIVERKENDFLKCFGNINIETAARPDVRAMSKRAILLFEGAEIYRQN